MKHVWPLVLTVFAMSVLLYAMLYQPKCTTASPVGIRFGTVMRIAGC